MSKREEKKCCKSCGAEIISNVKACPSCGAKVKKPFYKKWWFWLIIAFAAIIIFFGGDDASVNVNNNDANGAEAVQSSDDAGNIGTTASPDNIVMPGGYFEANGLKVTVEKAEFDYEPIDNSYGLYDLENDLIYLAMGFTFENTGDQDVYVSIYDFDCYADNSKCEQQFIPDGGDFINANLSSGRNVSFSTFYAVPKDASTIELEYTANIWTEEKVIIKVQ